MFELLGCKYQATFPFPRAFPHNVGHRGAPILAGACRPCCDTNKISDNPDRKYHSNSLRFWNNFFSEILVVAFPPAPLTNGILLFLAIRLGKEKAKPPQWPQTHRHLSRLSLNIFSSFLKTSNCTKRKDQITTAKLQRKR